MLTIVRFVVCALAVLAATTSVARSPAILTAATALTDLRGVDELEGMFNKDVGKVRLVLLVSPT